MPSEKSKEFNVVIDDLSFQKPSAMKGIVASLRKAGLDDVEVLEEIGIVTGRALPGAHKLLLAVPGVQAVEESHDVEIPEKELVKSPVRRR
ncbi:MAG: hypothetical protein ACOYLQ_05235 [Hyphomicrobiaceae bacterium]|jgi:hypothetical protein